MASGSSTLTPVRKVQTDNQTLSLIQDSVADAVDDLNKIPLINGFILKNVAVTLGLNKIPHRLNRKLVGWHVARTHKSALYPIITDSHDDNPDQDKTLWIGASADGSVDLWVY